MRPYERSNRSGGIAANSTFPSAVQCAGRTPPARSRGPIPAFLREALRGGRGAAGACGVLWARRNVPRGDMNELGVREARRFANEAVSYRKQFDRSVGDELDVGAQHRLEQSPGKGITEVERRAARVRGALPRVPRVGPSGTSLGSTMAARTRKSPHTPPTNARKVNLGADGVVVGPGRCSGGDRRLAGPPLEPVYPLVFFDALRVKVRDEGIVRNKAVHIALGVRADGGKEILGLWLEQNEGAKFWLRVMNELRNRGVDDILLAVIDGLKGFPDAILAVFPNAMVQTCIVHLLRQSLDFVSYKDRKPVAAALKGIYRALDADAGEAALAALHVAIVGAGATGTELAAELHRSTRQLLLNAAAALGGTQRVIVQHVTVSEGGQAVVAGQVETGGPATGRGHDAGGGVPRNEKTNLMRAFSANAWPWLMPRLGVARGALMVRGAEVLRWRTVVVACTAGQAPDRAHLRGWSGRAGPTGSTGTTRRRPSKCGERRVSSCSCFGS